MKHLILTLLMGAALAVSSGRQDYRSGPRRLRRLYQQHRPKADIGGPEIPQCSSHRHRNSRNRGALDALVRDSVNAKR